MADFRKVVYPGETVLWESELGCSGFFVETVLPGTEVEAISDVKIHIPCIHGEDSDGNKNWMVVGAGAGAGPFFANGNKIVKVYARSTGVSAVVDYGPIWVV